MYLEGTSLRLRLSGRMSFPPWKMQMAQPQTTRPQPGTLCWLNTAVGSHLLEPHCWINMGIPFLFPGQRCSYVLHTLRSWFVVTTIVIIINTLWHVALFKMYVSVVFRLIEKKIETYYLNLKLCIIHPAACQLMTVLRLNVRFHRLSRTLERWEQCVKLWNPGLGDSDSFLYYRYTVDKKYSLNNFLVLLMT